MLRDWLGMEESPQLVERLSNFRIAVTGGNGFIGRRLLKRLEVVGIEVLNMAGDIRDDGTWSGEFDLLYHLAAAIPASFAGSPEQAYATNVSGVLKAVEACRRRGARMVFVSTCGVYNPETEGALTEEHPLGPRTAYTQSKLIGEELCRSYGGNYGVKVAVFRLFNPYGGGQKNNFVIPYLIKCALESSQATIEHIDSARDFVHVDDVVAALMRVVSDNSAYALFNIGAGQLYRIRDIVREIEAVTGKQLSWTSGTKGPDPYPSVYADINRAGRFLDWHPQVSISQGLRETAGYFDKII